MNDDFVGVLGDRVAMRTQFDQAQKDMFDPCKKVENYSASAGVAMGNQYYGQRSAKDQEMLKEFSCNSESFQYNGITLSDHQKRKKMQENYCGPCKKSTVASLLDDPYNPYSGCTQMKRL